MNSSQTAQKTHIDYFLKNLPDTAMTDAFVSLVEYELILKEQFKRTITILKDIEKRLKAPEMTSEKVISLRNEFDEAVRTFHNLSNRIQRDVTQLRLELKDKIV